MKKALIETINRENRALLERLDSTVQAIPGVKEALSIPFRVDMSDDEIAALRARQEKAIATLRRVIGKTHDELQHFDPLIQEMAEKAAKRQAALEAEQAAQKRLREALFCAFAAGMKYSEAVEHVSIGRKHVWATEKKWINAGRPDTREPGMTVRQVEALMKDADDARARAVQVSEKRTEEVIELVRTAHRAGVSMKRTSEVTGIPRSTLRVWVGLSSEWNRGSKTVTEAEKAEGK
jgi:hypothetical protein